MSLTAQTSSESSEVSVRVAGAITGVVFVSTSTPAADGAGRSPWGRATIGDLRCEVHRLLGAGGSCAPTLLASGKRLMDDSQTLECCGLGPASKVLVMRGSSPAAGGAAAAASSASSSGATPSNGPMEDLDRIKKSAEAMAKRYAGGGGGQGRLLSLENQNGEAIKFGTPEDSKALVMGLTLHQKGQASMRKGAFELASKELLLAEEAMNLVDLDRLQINIDNKALLLIDLVWCWLKLQDRSCLAVAAKRLQEARKILSKSHGENLERIRVLHGDFCPELATYVRLELLEGAGLFYQGETASALQKLQSAQAKLQRLSVSDEALAELSDMGFTAAEASRALRFCSGDVASAVECVMKHRAARKEAEDRDQDYHRKRREMLRYGTTKSGKHVDMDHLEFLVSMGQERELAAEALRQTDNNQCSALDILNNELAFTQLQLSLADKNERKRARRGAPQPQQPANSEHVAALAGMGFSAEAAGAALRECDGSVDRAAEKLLANGGAAPPRAPGRQTTGHQEDEAVAAGPAAVEEPESREEEEEGEEEEEEEVDADMEGILAADVRGDPMDAYDVDVSEEGAAIQQYLAMVMSLQGVPLAQQQQ